MLGGVWGPMRRSLQVKVALRGKKEIVLGKQNKCKVAPGTFSYKYILPLSIEKVYSAVAIQPALASQTISNLLLKVGLFWLLCVSR